MSKLLKTQVNKTPSKQEPDFDSNDIAEAILVISKAMKALSGSRLKREAIVALIKDKSGLNKGTIEVVLNNLDRLEETWLKKVRNE